MAEVVGQRIVNFVETTNPSNQDYLATDNASNGNRKISYVTLSDKVLDKLSTKTFSLDGSNKTVLDALAELFQADDTLNARIDNIITPSGQPSMTELADIRTNFLGITYGSAGEAVRQSDMIASGFEHNADSVRDYGTPEHTTPQTNRNYYMTYTFDVSRYKGGRAVFEYNSEFTPVDASNVDPTADISEYMYMCDDEIPWTSTWDNAVAIADSADVYAYMSHGFVRTIKEYGAPLDRSCFRKVMVVPIPEDFPYQYIWFSLPSDKFDYANWDGNDHVVPYPEVVMYGEPTSGALTFTDENSDGNIVIS